jgi:hypothetical protein
MTSSQAMRKSVHILATAWVVVVCFALTANSAHHVYTPKDPNEVDIFSTVLSAEVKANNWTKRDLICFSVNALDPDKKLVKDIRLHGLNVCSSADWRRSFSCGFQVDFQIIDLALPEAARIRAEVADVREINRGEGDLAILVRKGEYSLHRTEGKWSVAEYVPAK